MNGLDGWRRFAVYWMPEPGALADFGAAWLGWDALSGVAVPHPEVPDLPAPVEQITRTPRKYGFHGTIKPPFRLGPDSTAAGLATDLESLTRSLVPARMEGLAVSRLGPFLALTPRGDAGPLAALAGAVVAGLDPHRAPPDAAEIARRNPESLTPAQRANLERWGYPYVMDEFRFHITLSGALPADQRAAVAGHLAQQMAPILPAPFLVDSLCLCGEGADGRFRLIHRYPLGR